MRDMCAQCSLSPESPCVRSACVVSMEMNPSFQVMADTFKQEEKQSSNCPLQTPRDASVTHILVFPTSATAQVTYWLSSHLRHRSGNLLALFSPPPPLR